MSIIEHKSFGIIAYKKSGDEIFFLLVQNESISRGRHWGFPKGTPEEGEDEEQTARREFEEETGIKSPDNIFNPDLIEKYSFFDVVRNSGVNKINKYFIGEIEKEIKVGEIFLDIVDVSWKNFEDALKTITFDESKEILKLVYEKIKNPH